MQIKLSRYNLGRSWDPDNRIEYGMQVCPSNGATSVGTIVDISKKKKEVYWSSHRRLPESITVLWGTGKKRGKRMEHEPENLIDFTKYISAVRKEYDDLTALQSEAQTLGI